MKPVYTLLLILFSLIARAQGNAGIIYGDNHAYTLKAPAGWVLNNQSGVMQGLYAVFYPEGDNWEDAVTVMYTNTANYGPGNEDMDAIIKYDLDRFVAAKPGIDIRTLPAYKLKDGKTAAIRHIYGDDKGNYEAIAYIPEKTVTVMVILTARNKEDFEKSLPKFNELLDSYSFIAEKVIEK